MQNLTDYWDLPAQTEIMRIGQVGTNNKLYRLNVSDTQSYVLRVYGQHAKPQGIQHELSVLTQLNRMALPFAVTAPIPTRHGEWWALLNDNGRSRLAILMPFIAGANPEIGNLVQSTAVGEALARLLLALKKVDTAGLKSPPAYLYLDAVHPLVPDPLIGLSMLGGLLAKQKQERLSLILLQVHTQAQRIYKALGGQLTHGDFIHANILADAERVTGVLDFEFCARNPRVLDLAVALDTWGWVEMGSGREWAHINAFGRGFGRVISLTTAEIEALPTLILLREAVVLIHMIGRFVAGASPYIDVEQWLDSMLQIDAWLTLNRQRLMDDAGKW